MPYKRYLDEESDSSDDNLSVPPRTLRRFKALIKNGDLNLNSDNSNQSNCQSNFDKDEINYQVNNQLNEIIYDNEENEVHDYSNSNRLMIQRCNLVKSDLSYFDTEYSNDDDDVANDDANDDVDDANDDDDDDNGNEDDDNSQHKNLSKFDLCIATMLIMNVRNVKLINQMKMVIVVIKI
jgi:hypothetical protein